MRLAELGQSPKVTLELTMSDGMRYRGSLLKETYPLAPFELHSQTDAPLANDFYDIDDVILYISLDHIVTVTVLKEKS